MSSKERIAKISDEAKDEEEKQNRSSFERDDMM